MKAFSKSSALSDAPTSVAMATKRLWRSASVSRGLRAVLRVISINPSRFATSSYLRFTSRIGILKDAMTLRTMCGPLERGYFAIVVAIYTYPMRWLDAAFTALQHIGVHTRSKRLHFIVIFLSVPCFKASHFFFKLAYLMQQRRLSRIGRYCALHGGEDLSVHFPERIPEFSEVSHLYEFLKRLTRSIQGRHNAV